MKITACIILRDSAKTIEACLNSIKDYVDEIVCIVDKRTIDDTYMTVCNWTTGKISDRLTLKIDYYDWLTDSFADARNYAQSKCTGDWILIIDGDETLISIIQPDNNYDFYFAVIENIIGGQIVNVNSIRLHKKGMQYQGTKHELLITEGKKQGYTKEFIISTPEKSKEEIETKTKAHLETHFKQLETEPENHYVKAQIGNCYMGMGKFREAIDWYYLALLTCANKMQCAEICIGMYVSYSKLDLFNFAKFYLEYSIELCPNQYMARTILYEHYKKDNPAKAEEQKEAMIKIFNNGGSLLSVDIPFNQEAI